MAIIVSFGRRKDKRSILIEVVIVQVRKKRFDFSIRDFYFSKK